MIKLTCTAVALALAALPAWGQTTLELRVVTDGGAGSIFGGPNQAVNVFIEGRLVGDPTDGLALWSADLHNTGYTVVDLCDRVNVLQLDAPAGAMQMFKRDLGLTNPSPGSASDTMGYSGTCDGSGGLLQIGGAQNTIHNTGPTMYPLGDPIALDVAGNGWMVLADGAIFMPTDFAVGDSLALELSNAVAATIDSGQAGLVYTVSRADTSIVGTLYIDGGPPPPNPITEVWSWGYHDGPVNADLGIPLIVAGSSVEPRVIDDASARRLYIEVVFDFNMTAGPQSVSTSPAIAGVTAIGDGSYSVLVTFPVSAPLDETCYNFDMAGSTAVGGGVEPVGVDFCVCYLEADVNRDGVVNPGDRNQVVFPINLYKAADEAFDVTADVDRSGVVNIGDKNLVISALNFWHTASPCP
jgi:hypothetical protein